MMLAAIPGELIGLVIFAVAALLKWLGDRATEQEATKTPPRSASAPRTENFPSPSSWQVDEERKRKFMEALGLPADDQLSPRPAQSPLRPPQPQVTPPALPRPSSIPPIPPIVHREQREIRQKRQKQRQQLPPVPTVVVAEPPPVPVAQAPAPVEPQPSGFELEHDISRSPQVVQEREPRDPLAVLREELGRPDSLRRAFVLREILGPPPGLQMPGSPHSFRAP